MDFCVDRSEDNVHTEVFTGVDGQDKDSGIDNGADIVHTEKEIRVKVLEKDKNSITVSGETVRQTDILRVVNAWNDLQGCGIKPISQIGSKSKR